MIRAICHFSGRVQGVGFRYTAQNLAMQRRVGGYVRNLPDGRVELIVEGAEAEVDGLIGSLQERLGHFIERTDRQAAPATGEFSDFSIRH